MAKDDRPDSSKRVFAPPSHYVDDWDANCHGFENGVDWCRDPATWSPAMAARAADIQSGAWAQRLRDGLPEWPDRLLDVGAGPSLRLSPAVKRSSYSAPLPAEPNPLDRDDPFATGLSAVTRGRLRPTTRGDPE